MDGGAEKVRLRPPGARPADRHADSRRYARLHQQAAVPRHEEPDHRSTGELADSWYRLTFLFRPFSSSSARTWRLPEERLPDPVISSKQALSSALPEWVISADQAVPVKKK